MLLPFIYFLLVVNVLAKLCPLFSGSKANCTYINGSDGAVLIDAGASCRAILSAIEEIDESVDSIRAILITHEHGDHIRGLKALSKKLDVPVIASADTLKTLCEMQAVDSQSQLIAIDDKMERDFGVIQRFETMHDCVGSSGFCINLAHQKISVCTDLGVVTSSVRNAITGSDIILIESNHDLRMLQNGPYPPELKLRIAGERGHLSNSACASELVSLLHSGTTRFVLGHISENNNLPTLAMRTSQSVLMDAGAIQGEDYLMYCAVKENREIIYL